MDARAHVVRGVAIRGIASAVPENVVTLEDSLQAVGDSARTTAEVTGIFQRHVTSANICASDLCFAAAERLLSELQWERDSIDHLVFVTQYPDYFLPANSCLLHGRLALSKSCACLDINLGCSGYVYGLSVASALLSTASSGRCLLLVGDTPSKTASAQDKSVSMLFGDAGTATALESDSSAPPMYFHLGSDGKGYRHLIVPAGGFRRPCTTDTKVRIEREAGNWRSEEELFMDGPEIFAFTMREVPPLIRAILETAGWSVDSTDAFVFHQANRFMIQYLQKKLRLPTEKVPITLGEYGNTSCASIPLAINTGLRSKVMSGQQQLVMAGFGVGLSWGAAAVTCGPVLVPDVITVSDRTLHAGVAK
jgi:3-oxoacyl-[acyl-carrier-protein] synthase-3